MFSRTKSTSRRTVARIAVAGAMVALPLAALTVPASADPATGGPSVTEVRHNRWDCDRRGPFDDWNHSPGRWDNCNQWDDPWDNDPWDNGRWNDPWRSPRHLFPGGSFGSS